MGMDCYGKEPTSVMGEYFRNNVWWWHPLADYCQGVAPQYAGIAWHFNDGDGLNAEDSVKLADILQSKINDGSVAKFTADRKERLEGTPDEECHICNGTGTRDDAIMKGKCNNCKGEGKVRPFGTFYHFSVENVQEFANFLRDSGGFKID